MASERIMQELKGLGLSENNIQDGNLFHWKLAIKGPSGPYMDKALFVDIKFPTQYPSEPPKVRITTEIVHPNVNSDGSLRLAILESWSPSYTINKVIHSVYSVLSDDANPDEPEDKEENYKITGRRWTKDKYDKLVNKSPSSL